MALPTESICNQLIQGIAEKGRDAQILQILDTYGFHDLPETDKELILTDWLTVKGFQVWTEVFKNDNLNCLKILLPLTPLSNVNKDNIPSELAWIESPEWMQNVFHENKARWNPEGCECVNHNMENPNIETKLCIMKELAFSMLASVLFSIACKSGNAKNCMLYLLEIAPNLTNMKVAHCDNRLPFDTALMERCPIAEVLLERRAPVGNLGKVLETLFAWKANSVIPDVTVKTSIELMKDKHEELQRYRDGSGNSLLYCLHGHNAIRCDGYGHEQDFLYTKQLLECGIDPMEKKTFGYSVLDCILSNYMQYAHDVMSLFISGYMRLTEGAESFQWLHSCLQVTVSMLSGGLHDFQLVAPSPVLTDNPTPQTIILGIIQNLELLLNNGVINVDTTGNFVRNRTETFFGWLLRSNVLSCEKKMTCSLCLPVVSLYYTVLTQESDVRRNVSAGHSYIELIVNSLYQFKYRPLMGLHPVPSSKCLCHVDRATSFDNRQTSCDCCCWELFELISHCQADLTRVLDTTKTSPPLSHLLFDHKKGARKGGMRNLSNITRIINVIWRYHPQSKGMVESFLGDFQLDGEQNSSNTEQSDNDDGLANDTVVNVINGLEELMQSVRPLMLLCRICVLQRVLLKDVEQLPLPRQLKQYIHIGDISPDHVVHKVLSQSPK